MTMFNVVFVVDPPLLEYSMRVKEIYENIIKKFAKALKWEQARTDYVWKESQHILQVRRRARESSMLYAHNHPSRADNDTVQKHRHIIFTRN